MSVRDTIEMVVSLGVPIDPILDKDTELRFAEDLPGMGGKLHPMPLLPEDVDPVKLHCSALFEDDHADAGVVSGSKLASLLMEGRLCTHCLNRLTTVNVPYLALVERVALPIRGALQNAQGLRDELAADPLTESVNPLGLALIARNPGGFRRQLADVKEVEGFVLLEPQMVSELTDLEVIVPQIVDALRPRADFAEIIAAIDADKNVAAPSV